MVVVGRRVPEISWRCRGANTHTHTRTHDGTHARTHAHTHTRTHTHTHTRAHARARTHARARAHTVGNVHAPLACLKRGGKEWEVRWRVRGTGEERGEAGWERMGGAMEGAIGRGTRCRERERGEVPLVFPFGFASIFFGVCGLDRRSPFQTSCS